MARKSVIERELKRINLCKKLKPHRTDLKTRIAKLRLDPMGNYEKLQELTKKFHSLPRDASPCRLRRRCRITGRSRGVYRKVGLSRSMFRLHAMQGDIPGLVKSSW